MTLVVTWSELAEFRLPTLVESTHSGTPFVPSLVRVSISTSSLQQNWLETILTGTLCLSYQLGTLAKLSERTSRMFPHVWLLVGLVESRALGAVYRTVEIPHSQASGTGRHGTRFSWSVAHSFPRRRTASQKTEIASPQRHCASPFGTHSASRETPSAGTNLRLRRNTGLGQSTWQRTRRVWTHVS